MARGMDAVLGGREPDPTSSATTAAQGAGAQARGRAATAATIDLTVPMATGHSATLDVTPLG
jgi:hypothetical protein